MLNGEIIPLESIISKGNAEVGLKQFSRLVKEGNADMVILAEDADVEFVERVEKIAKKGNLKIIYVKSKKLLGTMVNIEVPAGVVTIKKV